MAFSERDSYWMQQALAMAAQAAQEDEVPVGAVVVLNDEIIGTGYNHPISKLDPTAHAEVVALRNAAHHVGNYRLLDATLYVTLEPCIMCAGAMVHARIKRLVFGASDTKAGAVVSQASVFDKSFLNHRVAYEGGLLAQDCGRILSEFFKAKRQ